MKSIWTFLIIFTYCVLSAAEWHYPLYLDGGAPYPVRHQVVITNTAKHNVEGEILRIPARELGPGKSGSLMRKDANCYTRSIPLRKL